MTSFSSTSASNAAGVFLRSNGTNDYDLSLGGDGMVYLRRSQISSTQETCTSGTSSAASGVTVTTTGCTSANPCTPGWFKLKLAVSGTVAGGITITGYVDPTGSSGYTQVLQCVQNPGTQYMIDTGTAGVFAKGSAPAEYDDVLISTPDWEQNNAFALSVQVTDWAPWIVDADARGREDAQIFFVTAARSTRSDLYAQATSLRAVASPALSSFSESH